MKDVRDFFNNAPWWAKASPLVMLNVVLIFLLAQSAGWVPSVSEQARTGIVSHVAATAARSTVIDQALLVRDQKIDELLRRLTLGLRIMCENNAKNDLERRHCSNIQ